MQNKSVEKRRARATIAPMAKVHLMDLGHRTRLACGRTDMGNVSHFEPLQVTCGLCKKTETYRLRMARLHNVNPDGRVIHR